MIILPLANVIDDQFCSVSADVPLEAAIVQLSQSTYGALIVITSNSNPHYAGILRERDVIRLLTTQTALSDFTVSHVMTRSLPVVSLTDLQNPATVIGWFQEPEVTALPVVDEQANPIGWLTCQRLLQAYQRATAQDATHTRSEPPPIGVAQEQAEIALRRQLKRALLLQKVTDAIRSQLDRQQILEATVTQVGQAFHVNRCLLLTYRVQSPPQFLVAAEYVEPGSQPLPMRTFPFKANPYARQILAQDGAIVSANVYADRLLQPTHSLCQQFELKSMLTVRTSYQGEPNGALSLHQCDRFRRWTNSEVHLLEAIAAQVGIALAQVKLLEQEKTQRQALDQQNTRLRQEIRKRKQAEAALNRSNAFLKAQQEAAIDGILVVDEYRRVIWFNHRFAEVWQIPPDQVQQLDSPQLLQQVLAQLEHPQDFLNRVEYLYAHPQEIGHEEVALKDGRFLERYSAPVASGTGKHYGRVWFFRDISERKQSEHHLAQRERYLAVLVEIQRYLLAAHPTEQVYPAILQKLGQASSADRVYLFENHLSSTGTLLMSQRAEWCAASIAPEMDNPVLQNLPYDDFFPRWATMLSQGESLNGIVADFPESERAVLEPQGIQAILILPLMVNQSFWGFIGFDNCTETRPWNRSEVSLLGVAASAISLYQEGQQAEAALHASINRERATLRMIERMRQTLDLEQIFDATVAELRQLLSCDRVLVFQFASDWSGECVAESCIAPWVPMCQPNSTRHHLSGELCQGDRCQVTLWKTTSPKAGNSDPAESFSLFNAEKGYSCVNDIAAANLHPTYVNFLQQLQAKAYLVVPIYQGNHLWGLLAVYQNTQPRVWDPSEINLVIYVSTQLSIALQQAELLSQTQKQSTDLEKARDAAESANRAKSEFLANISHELRTPLNAILGFTQVMSRDIANPKHQEYISIINRSGQHLLRLINDVLEMSKIEAGRHRLNLTSFDLYRLLDALYELLSLKAQAKQVNLSFQVDAEVPQYVTADEGKLRQVLLNLLGNAIKFTQAGSVTLRVQVGNQKSEPGNHEASREELTDSASHPSSPIPPPPSPIPHPSPLSPLPLQFEVEDSGAGIAPEEISHLFTPFMQTHTGQQSAEGTGLGLAISQKFVQLMGGIITVNSVPGQGSCFRFHCFVTIAQSQDLAIVPSNRRILRLEPDQPACRILIVEDRWENCQLLVELLAPVGFEIQVASQGAEGIRCWQKWRPHLILMDIRMPVMDGYEATRQIRAMELQSRGEGESGKAGEWTTKIIAITSSAFEEDRAAILAIGCDDFISKPFQEEVIFSKLAEHLSVRYVYEESGYADLRSPINQTENKSLMQKMLHEMPQTWINQLYQASIQGRDTLILELIQQIPETQTDFIKELTLLTSNFQFEAIIELISH